MTHKKTANDAGHAKTGGGEPEERNDPKEEGRRERKRYATQRDKKMRELRCLSDSRLFCLEADRIRIS